MEENESYLITTGVAYMQGTWNRVKQCSIRF